MRNEKLPRGGARSDIRYAQCWEDADILLQALDIQPDSTCLSIASGGDNTLALLSRGPRKVFAIDLNAAQLAVLELRVAGYRELQHAELLALHGSTESRNRQNLYLRCRKQLSNSARAYWDQRSHLIEAGFGSAGRLERYFRLFRDWVLPFSESRRLIERFLTEKSGAQRVRLYDSEWNNLRWRLLLHIFCSRLVMGRLGRDPKLFRYVKGTVAHHIVKRTRHAMTVLDPTVNPYLHWIFTGRHRDDALPFALRAENFDAIRAHLDRLEWRCCSLEKLLEDPPDGFDAFNLSDIFEYLSPESYERLLRLLIRAAKPGARLAYWNLLVPRSRPESLANELKPLTCLADRLFARSNTFFYGAFVLEQVISPRPEKPQIHGLEDMCRYAPGVQPSASIRSEYPSVKEDGSAAFLPQLRHG